MVPMSRKTPSIRLIEPEPAQKDYLVSPDGDRTIDPLIKNTRSVLVLHGSRK